MGGYCSERMSTSAPPISTDEYKSSNSSQIPDKDDKSVDKNRSDRKRDRESSSPRPKEAEPAPKRKKSGWDMTAAGEKVTDLPKETLDAIQQAQQFAEKTNQANEQKAIDTVAAAEYAMKCRIYVGSLPFDGVTDAHIHAAFSPFGQITHINHCINPQTARSRGFCFIDFSRPESAQLAMQKMNGQILFGRSIKVGPPHGNPSMGPPVNVKSVQPIVPQTNLIAPPPVSVPGSKIYVGSINYDLTAEDIRATFSVCGKILSCQLMPNPETGKHKGFGFVEFDSEATAIHAMKSMNGFPLGGRNLKVGPAALNGPTNI